MRIKRFNARTFSEALTLIKRELGPDAVILSSEQVREDMVELVAAVDNSEAPLARKSAGTASTGGYSDLRSEIERLRDAIVQMRNSGYEMRLPENRRRILSLLLKNSVKEEFAMRLCERASDLKSLFQRLSEELSTMRIDNSQAAIMLIGPTGVGKTTTLAKLAAREIRMGRKVAVVTLDTFRIGATDQLKRFSRLLNIPLEIVRDPSELKSRISKHMSMDRIFIDTAGRNPGEGRYLEELKKVYKLGLPIETHLLMSPNSDDSFLTSAYRHYSRLNIDCLGFTKLDESVKRGSIYNLSLLYQKPVAYITTGQRIPGDLAFPDSSTLARLVLGEGLTATENNGGIRA
ncbi:flagellar biosynthesis protein FlhF [bacterium BMS3Bbin06]|nr:flagellar biosynthesis protein FlhF [bacterium BMS3Abin08]GBE33825.1 flagellar biosynthesis protein FlhF [bacterium BMS3Bbin06]HDO35761.1 hypothetical protein [Nitrospirota bacterium]HDY70572.1 hypothetical protein [Nitrospirota bacterium]